MAHPCFNSQNAAREDAISTLGRRQAILLAVDLSIMSSLTAPTAPRARPKTSNEWYSKDKDVLLAEVQASTTTADRPAKWMMLPQTPCLRSKIKDGFIAVSNTQVYYAQFGAGRPVIFLHGGLANSNYWANQVAIISEHVCATVIDTRGHGRSPMNFGKFSYDILADDLERVMDFLEIPVAAIVGWSDGGITALKFAIKKPHRVSKLFLFGANTSSAGIKKNGYLKPVFQKFIERTKVEYSRLSPTPNDWNQLRQELDAMWQSDINIRARDLSSIASLTIVSDGEYDEIISASEPKYIASEISNATLVIQPNVSHFAMIQDPLQFNQILLPFLY